MAAVPWTEKGEASSFDPDCTQCPRLSGHLSDIRDRYPDYHAAPVAPFGPARACLLIVGLAPGMHGANATGRPFTGDYAGILLYRTLHDAGLANRPESLHADDGLKLRNCRITNAVKCLPPENKPTTGEVRNCNPFLRAELDSVPRHGVVLALGRIAHDAVLRALGCTLRNFPFAHGAEHDIEGERILIDSYHCSRYNTQTRRLTQSMFRTVIERARDLAAK